MTIYRYARGNWYNKKTGALVTDPMMIERLENEWRYNADPIARGKQDAQFANLAKAYGQIANPGNMLLQSLPESQQRNLEAIQANLYQRMAGPQTPEPEPNRPWFSAGGDGVPAPRPGSGGNIQWGSGPVESYEDLLRQVNGMDYEQLVGAANETLGQNAPNPPSMSPPVSGGWGGIPRDLSMAGRGAAQMLGDAGEQMGFAAGGVAQMLRLPQLMKMLGNAGEQIASAGRGAAQLAGPASMEWMNSTPQDWRMMGRGVSDALRLPEIWKGLKTAGGYITEGADIAGENIASAGRGLGEVLGPSSMEWMNSTPQDWRMMGRGISDTLRLPEIWKGLKTAGGYIAEGADIAGENIASAGRGLGEVLGVRPSLVGMADRFGQSNPKIPMPSPRNPVPTRTGEPYGPVRPASPDALSGPMAQFGRVGNIMAGIPRVIGNQFGDDYRQFMKDVSNVSILDPRGQRAVLDFLYHPKQRR